MRAPDFKHTVSGHGHVYPREDGKKTECGGPRHCKACRDDLVANYEAGAYGEAVVNAQYTDPHATLAVMMEAMKAQLLIVLVNRMGGKATIPVSEIDGTGQWMLGMEVDQTTGIFTFNTRKKS